MAERDQGAAGAEANGGGGSTPELAGLDEVLQLLFWLHGEHLAQDAGVADLAQWLARSPEEIQRLLDRLVDTGEALRSSDRYALSERGLREGGRRFADEFSGLTAQGHAECNDPDCDCRTSGDPADCHHAHS